MIKQQSVIIAKAFAGVVPGIENANSTLEGYEGTETHPCLPAMKPVYRMSKVAFQTLAYVWAREWARDDTAPRRGIWFSGPKGAGKTTLPEQFFARLGVPVVAKTCNRRIPLSDYFQQTIPDGAGGWMQIDGPIKLAMEMGYPVILNEPSAMDPADLIALHDIIDRGYHVMETGEVIKAKRGFIVFATDNTGGFGDANGSYAGVNTMNTATMSRFLKLEVSYLEEQEEVDLLAALFEGQEEDVLRRFVQLANMVRAAYMSDKSAVTIGTRELIDWAEAAIYFTPLAQTGIEPAWFGLQRVIVDGLPPAEARAIRQHYDAVFMGAPA